MYIIKWKAPLFIKNFKSCPSKWKRLKNSAMIHAKNISTLGKEEATNLSYITNLSCEKIFYTVKSKY